MNILHVTGMPFPTKYGSIEKWLVENCRYANNHGSVVHVAYEKSVGQVCEYHRDIEKNNCKYVVLKTDDDILSYCCVNQIDIVHFHFSFCGYNRLYKELFKLGIRLFVHIHCENDMYVHRAWKRSVKSYIRVSGHRLKTWYTARFIETFFPCSKVVAKEYQKMYFWPDKKVKVHYLGISRETNVSKKSVNDIPVISCIAFHSPIKGVDVLLNALKLLKDEDVLFQCYQIGGGSAELNGEDTQILHEQCTALGLDDNVIWVGLTNHVNMYLRKSDIYCQPSRTEAISLSIAEAMQNGLPVVASKVGGVPELVHDGVNGYTVAADKAEILAEKLRILISDTEMRLKMGKQSQKILNDLDFFQDRSVIKLWSYYKL